MLASSRMLLLPHSYEAVVKLLLDMGASTRTPRTLMVGRCCRGPQRTGTRRWSSCSSRVALCPYDLHFCSTPPNPPPVAGLFSRTTWAWQMESRRKREK
jgi:hypothetical protein